MTLIANDNNNELWMDGIEFYVRDIGGHWYDISILGRELHNSNSSSLIRELEKKREKYNAKN